MQSKHNIMETMLGNLKAYCLEAYKQFDSSKNEVERSKIFVKGSVYSHHDEIDKRLVFI